MNTYIVLIISFLLLLSYFFEITSKKTKIPTVLLLIVIGWALKQLAFFFNIKIPSVDYLVEGIGTIGLIFIVFEATIDLKFTKEKLPTFIKSILFSFLSILIFSILFAVFLNIKYNIVFYKAFLNAIPFSVISSAIAIPSTSNYRKIKEFIVYDSTFSDIFGILIFNLVLKLENGNVIKNFTYYFLELILLLIISILAIIVLAIFVKKIKHHVKFIPILIFMVFLYHLTKIYHLPGLIFVLIFGLSVANFDHIIKRSNKYFSKFHIVLAEIPMFKSIVNESTFLVRSIFFLLLGFSITISNTNITMSLILVLILIALIYVIRFILLKVFRFSIKNYLFLAPRGLISIVLFLAIPSTQRIDFINKNFATYIILASTVLMSISLYFTSNKLNE
ncbi:MAG: hypothetical protein ACUVQP_01525 [Bacteroidales bacterium]